MTPDTKVVPRTKRVVRKVVKRVVKKTPGNAKTPVTAKVLSVQTPKMEETVKAKVEESAKEEIVGGKDFNCTKNEELATENLGESTKQDQTTMEVEETMVENAPESAKKGKTVMEPEESVVESAKEDQSIVKMVGESAEKGQTAMEEDIPPNDVTKSSKNEEPTSAEKGDELKEELKEIERKNFDDKEEPRNKAVNMEAEDVQPEKDDYAYGGDEGYEEYGDRVDFGDHGEDDFIEDDPEETAEEAEALEEECRELTALAKERKNKKEYEIFVGGLDRDATEEDLRKVFEKIGEVVEVRLHRNLSTNKNKGYAFVKFANKEHAKHALLEMKNPVV